jgi:hypothetical protein
MPISHQARAARRIGIDALGIVALMLWSGINRALIDEFGWPMFLVMVIVLYLGIRCWMHLAAKYPYAPKHGVLPDESSPE